MKEHDPILYEIEYVKNHFNLEEYLEFQYNNDIQIIRGGDYQYGCFINKKCYYNAITPLFALVIGIKNFKQHI